MNGSGPKPHDALFQRVFSQPEHAAAELRHVLRLVEAGRLAPVVDRTFPLEEAPAAQTALENREQFGKIVLEVGADQ